MNKNIEQVYTSGAEPESRYKPGSRSVEAQAGTPMSHWVALL